MDEAGGLVEVSGTVYGVRLRGRLPAAFRDYLALTLDPFPDHDASHRGARGRGTPPAPRPRLRGSAEGGSAAPEAAVELGYRALDGLPEVEETWASEAPGPNPEGGGTVRFALFRLRGGFGLTVAGEGRGLFRCTSRRIDVEWTPPGTGAAHYLFTYALPLWLEAEGVPVLHASAVALDGRAVGFVGPTGIGKSVLCAELLRLGCDFVADDGLAVRPHEGREESAWRAFHGPPLLRLWPSGLEGRLGVPAGDLPRVHETLDKRRLPLPGAAAAAPPAGLPLAAVYSLRREPNAAGEVAISPCRPRDALVQLLEHGVAAAPAAALGLAGRRLELLAGLAEAVPVRRLRFPSGADSAARLLEAIRKDLGES